MYELQIDLYEKTPTTLLKYTLSDATHHHRALYAISITYFYLVDSTLAHKSVMNYIALLQIVLFLVWAGVNNNVYCIKHHNHTNEELSIELSLALYGLSMD